MQRARFGIVHSPREVRFALALAAIAILAPAARAADPSLGSIRPEGAQRGTEVDVVFAGARLGDAREVLIYEPGISVIALEAVDDNSFKARLAIADDCRLGNFGMRVRTATGISNLRTFTVGALPIVSETEPNTEFDQAQAIDLDVTVTGVVENEDVDFFRIEAKQGERITAEIEGIRLGNTFFDPYVSIMDTGRFELSASDDAALVWQDGVASIAAPEDGTYIIQVRESAYGGSGACTYRLHVGRFPRPRAVFPAGGHPGESLAVRWLGDVAGEWEETVTLPTEPGLSFGLLARDDRGVAPSWNPVRVIDLTNVIEAEPNDSPAEAAEFAAPAALNGRIELPGDVDLFKFAATKGQVYDVRVYARELRSPLDPVLNIMRSNGAGVAGNDDSGGPDSYLRFTAPEDDTYLLQVRDHLGAGGSTYVYRMELTPVAPRLTMGLPERSQFVDITVPVPQGNRGAILVSAGRADFGGELNVNVNNMPAGVSLETTPMAANQSIVPVLFTAAADAEVAGTLADVIGSHADPNIDITGHLVQTTSLVRGQNNRRVWDHRTERMAMAVTEAVPFTIDVVQPKVPLVRDGRMDLKIVATRAEGFTAPIGVTMLYNPPGVGSAGSISIAEGQNEAIIPLNANGNAEIRPWKVAVIGSSTVGNGGVLVSTQLADLEVADRFFTFAFQAAAVEKGKETPVAVNVTHNSAFEGEATVELLGLPNEVTAEPVKMTNDMEQLVFNVKTTANSPAGKHKTLLCRATVVRDGEPIVHMLGGGELRIDEPLPPKADAPAPAPMPQAEEKKPQEKPLTRLEQLRLEREQKKAALAAQRSEPDAAPAESEKPAEASQSEKPSGDSE